MAEAGTVVINLDANSAKLLREMQKAERSTKRSATKMRKDIEREFKAIGKQAAIMGAAIAGSMAVAVKSSVTFADSIAKTADKIGVGVESLQELRFAASQAGVAQNQLDMGLQRFARRVGEAVQGQGELKDTLKQYNIQLRDSEGRTRSVEAILRDYADTIAGAESSQEQLRLAFKAFDSEGAALVNLMRGGAAAIDGFAAQARELGIVLDERLVRQSEKIADNMDVLTRVFQVRIASVVLENADAINALVDALVRLIPPLINGTARMLEFFGVITELPLATRAENLEILRQDLRNLDAQMAGASGRNRAAMEQRKARLVQQLREEENAYKAQAARIEEFRARVGTPLSVGGVSPLSKQQQADAEKAAEAVRLAAQEKMDYEAAHAEYYINLQSQMADAEQQRILDAIEYEAQYAEYYERLAEQGKQSFDEMSEFANQAARNMQDALANFLFDPFQGGLDGMLRGFVDILRQMAAQAAAAAIFDSIGGAGGVGGFLAGIFGGARASGGPVSAGTPYLVGEEGPELIVPNRSGYVVPNDALGGTSMVVNIDARGSSDPAAILAAGAALKRDILATVDQRRRRGL